MATNEPIGFLILDADRGAELSAQLTEVAKDPPRGDVRPRARPANNQRRRPHFRAVPRGLHLDDVVRPLQAGEGVRAGKLGQLHAPRLRYHIHLSHEPQHHPLRRRFPCLARNDPIELGQARHVLLRRAGLKRPRDQRPHRHVRQRQVQSALPRRDHHLACHVQAVEVVARVGLGEARRARRHHNITERLRLRVPRVKQKGHGARENALHDLDAVARGAQGTQGADDG
mmetsp:Transcript_1954/g.4503  ORF Transcript_1954/g.4503 Transcript_1954/m.4503 type:complete len:228 (-) Transcript_1954:634-1317(-)